MLSDNMLLNECALISAQQADAEGGLLPTHLMQ